MKLETEAIRDLQNALRFRTTRQAVLAGNVANADTPGYRARDLEFEAVLGHEQLRMTGTHASHRAEPEAGKAFRVVTGPRGDGPDGNGVSLDDELIQMSRNAGAYQDEADILSRLMGLLRSAVAGEG